MSAVNRTKHVVQNKQNHNQIKGHGVGGTVARSPTRGDLGTKHGEQQLEVSLFERFAEKGVHACAQAELLGGFLTVCAEGDDWQ